MSTDSVLNAARAGDERAFRTLVSPYERELRAYCYRMAGSLDDVDDLLQESLVRAWRGLPSFEGRASVRTWLYRVAWSACVDALEKRPPRTLSIDEGPPSDPRGPIPEPRYEGWIGPCPSSLYADESPSPEARYDRRQSVTLAFLAALQLLPARQRAILLARDVLGWNAEECAATLDTTVAAVTSALQRARETLDSRAARWKDSARTTDTPETQALLSRYVHAWEQADVGELVLLLHEEATLAMPPLPMWLSGPHAIGASIGGMVFLPGARGAFRLIPCEANGEGAFAVYRVDPASDGKFVPMSLHILSMRDDRLGAITAFLDARLFAAFGLPPHLDP